MKLFKSKNISSINLFTLSPAGTSAHVGKKHCWRIPGNPEIYENSASGVLPFLKGDVFRQKGKEIQKPYKDEFLIDFSLVETQKEKGAYGII